MNYEINEGTLAIIPSKKNSIIYEDKKEYEIENTPFEIMDYSCKYFGSSYEGRKEGTKAILNVSYKVPIVIENSRNIIFFPTTSPRCDDCCWISLKNIEKIEADKYNSTLVIFKNGVSINIPVSIRTIQNQIFRASRLNLILRDREILFDKKVI